MHSNQTGIYVHYGLIDLKPFIRWLNGSVPALSLASCPFGVGSRVCIAKSIAETALLMFMMRIFSKFQVSWVGGDLEFISVPINKPNVPMLFKFDLRN